MTVYRDSRGFLTVGIGHLVLASDNLTLGDRISETRMSALFAKDGASALHSALVQVGAAGITDPRFIPYLASVNFQLGVYWTRKFPTTWAAICRGDYERAAEGLETSAWARETPVRVDDFVQALHRLPSKGTAPKAL